MLVKLKRHTLLNFSAGSPSDLGGMRRTRTRSSGSGMRSRLMVYRAEVVNVLGLIRTQTRQGSLVDLHPVGDERLQRFVIATTL